MVAVDLFAGCGGLSLGLSRGGIEVTAAFELWKDACNVYNANFDHDLHQVDLSDVEKATELISGYAPDLIAGGPPCQDFSSAGHRKDKGDRADLTTDYCSIVCTVQPTWFLMENVTRIQNTAIFNDVKKRFGKAGYGLTEVILNASLCGVPQRRKRVFLIGCMGERDGFLEPGILSKLAKKEMTVRDHFGTRLGTEFYYRHARSYARRGIYSIDEPSATIRGVNRPIPPKYKFHPVDATNDLTQVRPLTTSERAQIQTFPAAFRWPVPSKTNLEQLIGNAVPVNLARLVAEAIVEHDAGLNMHDAVAVEIDTRIEIVE
ncbi:MAG: DNA cytosine methyltransferase [Flavobacteriales bacterium]|jgi:DNA (cytosine-5)-methyltransferase 1|nr:DNA cytosine methyltransferase [Flavobacteriales bacterium]